MSLNDDLLKTLKTHWGYDSFRPLQREIMESALSGHDTLALLPTGGGKSLCFQVPAMSREGLCLVVTPLIALMKDQVYNLNKQGIKATAVYSGMNRREIDNTFEGCAKGKYKFLYLSPERLKTELFRKRLGDFNINLLAIDEAHCISEWGYDFRPSYLEIAEIRELIPDVPVTALTATATERVRKDICERLKFKNEKVFQSSFRRKNLIFGAVHCEDKSIRLINMLKRIPGSGIIYLRSRAGTENLSKFLKTKGIRAEAYHAGMDNNTRSTLQQKWQDGRLPVIVATNAFGMGIDKPDVRKVIHMDLPESLEAYYQEAGRAGRDQKKAYGVLLLHPGDRGKLQERIEWKFPPIETVREVYHALMNYLQIPMGSGAFQSYDFDVKHFCSRYNQKPLIVYNCLKILEQEEIMSFSEDILLPARMIFTVDYRYLYEFQIENKKYEPVIKVLLRTYSGTFEEYVTISLKDVGSKLGIDEKLTKDLLLQLKKMNILDFSEARDKPQIMMLKNRPGKDDFNLNTKRLRQRKVIYKEKIDAIIEYAYAEYHCRNRIMLNYFGERLDENCGHCDFCLKKEKKPDEGKIENEIMSRVNDSPEELREMVSQISVKTGYDEDDILKVLRLMLDKGEVNVGEDRMVSKGR